MKKSILLTLAVFITICRLQAQNINTIAGDGTANYFGNGIAATAAEFFDPSGVTLDNAGNIYIADEANNVIRKINTSGIVTTIGGNAFGAGTFSGGYTGNGGPATAAELFYPVSIALDASGNIFFTDGGNNVVRKINTAGIITAAVGNGVGAGTFTGGYSGDGGPATAAEMNQPFGVAFDNSGNLYVADYGNNCVRKVNTAGIITTIAGTTSPAHSGDGGPATAAGIDGPTGVTVDNAGNIYIAEYGGNYVRKINTSGIISTIAGASGIGGYSGDGGPATAAELSQPITVSVDNANNIYISDQGNNVIRKINASGIISTYAGNGMPGYSGDGGPATNAQLSFPTCTAIDNSGNVLIADEGNNVIRKVGTILGAEGVCIGQSTTLTDITTGGTWSSSNPGVATIGSSSGLVTSVAVGTTIISYTLSGHTSTITFTVANPPAPITGTLTICGNSQTILSDATVGGTWSVSNPSVAFLFSPSFGEIEGQSAGTATVTYSTAVGCNVTATLNVLAAPEPVSGSSDICTGTAASFFDGTPGGTWISRNPSVAAVSSSGVVTGIAAGNTEIVYTLSSGCADSAFVQVMVSPTVAAITGPNTACVGATVTLNDPTVDGFWESSNNGIAQVSFGTVDAVAAGAVTISYIVDNFCGNAVATYDFTVNTTPVAGTITGPDTVCMGGSTTLANAMPGGSWSSGSNTIATITSSGTVYGALDGSVSIFYTVTNACGSANTSFPLMVVSNGACAALSAGNLPGPVAGEMQLYPNPNDGTFSINILSQADEQAHVIITNVVGAKVMDFTAPVNKNISVNMPKVSPGIYMLSAVTPTGKYMAKITVE